MSKRPKIRGIDIMFVSASNRVVWFYRPEQGDNTDCDPRFHSQPSVSSVLRAQRAQIALMQRMEASNGDE